MADRRPLVQAIKPKPEIERAVEEQFVFGDKDKPNPAAPVPPTTERVARPATLVSRVPLTTRVRADLAQALKRASLERQLQGIQPHTVQDILEVTLEPWLREQGYLN